MAKRGDKKIDYQIVEMLGTVSNWDGRTKYAKNVIRTLWNDDGELKDGLDIRWMDMGNQTNAFGGIRLTIAEAHKVCDILLENGYGSTEKITEAYKKRKSLTTKEDEPDE